MDLEAEAQDPPVYFLLSYRLRSDLYAAKVSQSESSNSDGALCVRNSDYSPVAGFNVLLVARWEQTERDCIAVLRRSGFDRLFSRYSRISDDGTDPTTSCECDQSSVFCFDLTWSDPIRSDPIRWAWYLYCRLVPKCANRVWCGQSWSIES